jgi:iron complex transport system substrate-binding protein
MRVRTVVLTVFWFAIGPFSGEYSIGVAGDGPRPDATGRKWELRQPVERIASLAPSVTEILYAIGAEDLIVGVSRFCDYPIAAKLKPKVGEFNRPDMERLKSAAPDVALFTEYLKAEDQEALDEAGIRYLVLPARNLQDILDTALELGKMSGRAESAQALADKIQDGVEAVRRKTGGLPKADRPRVYVEVDGPRNLYALGPESFMDDVIRLAGGTNIFKGAKAPYFAVAPEEIIRLNPDLILIDHPFQFKVGLSKRPGWDAIAAVRNGRVYDGTDYDIILLNRPGPRIVQSLAEVARILNPRIFNEQ